MFSKKLKKLPIIWASSVRKVVTRPLKNSQSGQNVLSKCFEQREGGVHQYVWLVSNLT